MKEKPIPFRPEMVKAILEGRKSMTRRPLKPQPYQITLGETPMGAKFMGWYEGGKCTDLFCPYGQVGDWLWVRETWWKPPVITPKDLREGADTWPEIIYDADSYPADRERLKEWGWKKKPSIHMFRWMSRITLEITGIRVEKIQDIPLEDFDKEGYEPESDYSDYLAWFATLWDSIHGEGAWDRNDFCWVISFRRINT